MIRLRSISYAVMVILGLIIIPASQLHAGDHEWSIEVCNTTDREVVYGLYYVDHPYQSQWPRPMNIAGGGIEPGKTWEWRQHWGPGRYYVLLQMGEYRSFVPFVVKENTVSVKIEVPSLKVDYSSKIEI